MAVNPCYTSEVITRAVRVATTLLLGAGVLVALPEQLAAAVTPVQFHKTIGHSVDGRPIIAYRLGDAHAKTTALILGQMHGDEHAGVTVANALIHGTRSVEGINLWVIPTMNPDGNIANTRQNARNVDLNRNWPDKWTNLDPPYYSGPRPLSEPETRAMFRFLKKLRPRYIVSLHQPLDGVDTTDGGALDRKFRNTLARNLHLQKKAFRCWSICHGSMTGWYTTKHMGIGETIEFPSSPSQSYLEGTAMRGIVHALGGRFGSLAWHNARTAFAATAGDDGTVTFTGWAWDRDKPNMTLRVNIMEGDDLVRSRVTHEPSPKLNQRMHVAGTHGFRLPVHTTPGKHRYCLVVANQAAGTGPTSNCTSVVVHAPS